MTDNQSSGRLRVFGAEIVQLVAVAGGTFRLSTARLLSTGDSLARNRRRPSRPDRTTEDAEGPATPEHPESQPDSVRAAAGWKSHFGEAVPAPRMPTRRGM